MNLEKIYSNFQKYYYTCNFMSQEVFIISEKQIKINNLEDMVIIYNNENIIKLLEDNNIITVVINFCKNKLKNINLKDVLDDEELINLIKADETKTINLKYCLIEETFEDYNSKVLPYIKSIYIKNTKWVYDILSYEKEINNILFDCKEFIIVREPSFQNYGSFYILGFPKKEFLYTIRELKKKDIKWLKTMKLKMQEIGNKLYEYKQDELYFFFHYHPSFYYLHLHCTYIGNNSLGNKFQRNILLEDVIQNLSNNKKFYNKKFYFEIPKNHILHKLIKNEN